MKHPLPTLALALGLSAFTPALAQQPAAASSRDESVEAAKLAYSRQIAEVKYDSLPLEEIVAGLRKEFPEINFILPEELGQVIVRLEMRNVRLTEIIQAIEIACLDDQIVIQQKNERLISIFRHPNARAMAGNKPVLRAINLTGYLATRPPAEQETAMKMVYELINQAVHLLESAREKTSPPRIEMHPGTKMLMAVGTSDQMQLLEEIVYNLPGMPGLATDPATGAPIAIRPSRTPGASGGSGVGGTQVDQRFLDRYGLSPQGGSPAGTSR
jgi:hypothetical protein